MNYAAEDLLDLMRAEVATLSKYRRVMKDILLVVKDNLEDVRECVDGIFSHTTDFHLYVWDNGSDEPTRDYLRSLTFLYPDQVTLISYPTNIGFIEPNNRLYEMGTSPYVILINSDCVPLSDWTEAMISHLQAEPDLAEVGYSGRMLGPQGTGVGPGLGDQADYLEGWCVALPRRVCGDTLFDGVNLEFAYGEDSDLSLRLRECGYRVKALANTRVLHKGSRTIRQVIKTTDTRASFRRNHEYIRTRHAAFLRSK